MNHRELNKVENYLDEQMSDSSSVSFDDLDLDPDYGHRQPRSSLVFTIQKNYYCYSSYVNSHSFFDVVLEISKNVATFIFCVQSLNKTVAAVFCNALQLHLPQKNLVLSLLQHFVNCRTLAPYFQPLVLELSDLFK
ncbi:hypothetical protein QTP88_007515 [Uroleucon formosanum]